VENIKSLSKLTPEEVAIKQAIANGHKNPRECINHVASLNADGADLQILEYRLVDIADLQTDNVRVQDVDTQRCRDVIGPLMNRKLESDPNSLGLFYPLLVTRFKGQYKLLHGHNRRWSMINILNKSQIPVFVIEDRGTAVQRLIGKIVANSPREDENRRYVIKDVILQLERFSTLGHFNLSDKVECREEFNLLMNKLHPNQFLAINARTRIFNQWWRKNTKLSSSIITWDNNYRDSVLSYHKYPSVYHQHGGKRLEYKWPCHKDMSSSVIIGLGVDNGRFNHAQGFMIMEKWTSSPSWRIMYKGYSIHLIARIHNVPSTIEELDDKRQDQLREITMINSVLSRFDPDCPKFTRVIFPKQLKIETSDKVYNFDNKKNKFV